VFDGVVVVVVSGGWVNGEADGWNWIALLVWYHTGRYHGLLW